LLPCRVPNLENATEDGARQQLATARLVLGEVHRRGSERRAGTVVEQSPAANTEVKCGSPVEVWLAVPQRVVRAECTVPNLDGDDPKGAAARLRENRLALGEVTGRPSDRPAGTIVAQKPAADARVDCGSRVDVWIAEPPPPPPPCLVPNLEGNDPRRATALLRDSQLTLGAVTRRPSDRPAGTIVAQKPAADARVDCGSRIDVWIAEPVPVRVPPLAGLTRPSAIEVLEQEGLELGEVNERESSQASGTVVDQAPAPETQVDRGSRVIIWLAIPVPSPPVEVPDVVGSTREAAVRLLKDRGLELGTVQSRVSDRPGGTVVEQSPQAGELVATGSTVSVSIATVQVVVTPPATNPAQDGQDGPKGTHAPGGGWFDRWPLLLLGTLLGLGAAAGSAWARTRFFPNIQVKPQADDGIQSSATESGDLVTAEVALQWRADDGAQSIEDAEHLTVRELDRRG
jgi:beta-lactam-binding protein with PASTA domain